VVVVASVSKIFDSEKKTYLSRSVTLGEAGVCWAPGLISN
jgi:hypothetical protein